MIRASVGRCFKVESSYGDDRGSWWIYRRVVSVGSTWVDCYRFERRAGGEYAMRARDAIQIEVLVQQIEISEEEWLEAYRTFHHEVAEPWHVE